jgi:hypothetical protein
MSQSEVFHKVLPCPPKPNHLPENIHWLSGEGCGSWFYVELLDENYIITRYSPDGKLECKGLFEHIIGSKIKLSEAFEVTYLSHCAEVNIIQNNINLKFKLLNKI